MFANKLYLRTRRGGFHHLALQIAADLILRLINLPPSASYFKNILHLRTSS